MLDSDTPTELREFPVGRVLAERYEILEHLGWGGMGMVVKARDHILNNEVLALKILFQSCLHDELGFERFKREVILSRKLGHPNIVRVYDFGVAAKNSFFISMEYVQGKTLKDVLAEHAQHEPEKQGIPFSELLRFLHQICLGLEAAHAFGVLHRDLKPANMLLSADGCIKISDFGVARSLDSKDRLTKTNEATGSPIYMSPEQLSFSSMDARSDVYSLGIMAFELAKGRPPFFAQHWIMLAKQHLSDPLPSVASKEAGIPLWFEELLNIACAKKPEGRFQSVRDFRRFLERHADAESLGTSEAIAVQSSSCSRVWIWLFVASVLVNVGVWYFLR